MLSPLSRSLLFPLAAFIPAIVVAQSPTDCCLVVNGDFEAGDVGFGSSLTYVPTGSLVPGQYSVRTDAVSANTQWCQNDHTSGTGNLLLCDPSGGTTTAWSQVVGLDAGETYEFSAWVNNLICTTDFPGDPVIELRVDGNAIGAAVTLTEFPDMWVRVSGTFVACSATPTLSIVAASGGGARDFGVDDICLEHVPNLITNGTFEDGNSGFTSTATHVASGPLTTDRYSVRADPSTANSQWCGVDHTCGSGLMLICDGNGSSETCAWRQSVDVCPGRLYTFSAWVDNLVCATTDFDDPALELRVDGTVLASAAVPETPDQWVQMTGTFTPTTTSVLLEICSTALIGTGNDFAIDDVWLTAEPSQVFNGDFEAGNVGFSSNAAYVATGIMSPGDYSVRTEATSANTQWCREDHTTGSGNFLLCDGIFAGNTIAWQQVVTVCLGESLDFSAYVDNVICSSGNFADPRIELRVNGNTIAGPVVLPESPDGWVRIAGSFVTSTTTVLLQVVSTQFGGSGNDFALDDISLRPSCPDGPGVTIASDCPAALHALNGPVLDLSGSPRLGTTLTISGSNLIGTPICALLIGSGIAPFPLSVIGSTIPGSSLCVDPFVSVGCGGASSASVPLAYPSDPNLVGFTLAAQWVDWTGTGADFGTSVAARLVAGN